METDRVNELVALCVALTQTVCVEQELPPDAKVSTRKMAHWAVVLYRTIPHGLFY
jgi:hypothetical protein